MIQLTEAEQQQLRQLLARSGVNIGSASIYAMHEDGTPVLDDAGARVVHSDFGGPITVDGLTPQEFFSDKAKSKRAQASEGLSAAQDKKFQALVSAAVAEATKDTDQKIAAAVADAIKNQNNAAAADAVTAKDKVDPS